MVGMDSHGPKDHDQAPSVKRQTRPVVVLSALLRESWTLCRRHDAGGFLSFFPVAAVRVLLYDMYNS